MNRTVRDLMHKGLITCPRDTPLGRVASLLAEHHVHALVVVHPDGRPAGLISDFDLLAGEWLSTDPESLATMRQLTAGNLMTSPIDTIAADTSLPRAAQVMLEKQVHRLVVTDRGEPAGILSISDIVASIAGQVPTSRDSVRDVMSDAFLVCREHTTITSAARTMSQTHWRSVIVINVEGRALGVVTGQDLLWHVDENGVYENLTVSDVMSHTLTTVDVHASLHEAANLMIQKHQHRLVVVDKEEPGGFPLGLISSFDIVAEMARPGSVWQS